MKDSVGANGIRPVRQGITRSPQSSPGSPGNYPIAAIFAQFAKELPDRRNLRQVWWDFGWVAESLASRVNAIDPYGFLGGWG